MSMLGSKTWLIPGIVFVMPVGIIQCNIFPCAPHLRDGKERLVPMKKYIRVASLNMMLGGTHSTHFPEVSVSVVCACVCADILKTLGELTCSADCATSILRWVMFSKWYEMGRLF